MAKEFRAPFPQTPKVGTVVVTAACTIVDDNPPNTVELLTAGTEGAVVTKLHAMQRATTSSAINLVLFRVKAGTTEKRLVSSVVMPAFTVAATGAIPRILFEYTQIDPLRLEAGDKLFVGAVTALAQGIVFTSQHTDY